MKVLVRMRYSQALRLVPGSNCANEASALVNVSWIRSSASGVLRVMRSAARCSRSRCGSASRSNRTARSPGVSAVTLFSWDARSSASTAIRCGQWFSADDPNGGLPVRSTAGHLQPLHPRAGDHDSIIGHLSARLSDASNRLGPDDIGVSRVGRKGLTPVALVKGLRPPDVDSLHCLFL